MNNKVSADFAGIIETTKFTVDHSSATISELFGREAYGEAKALIEDLLKQDPRRAKYWRLLFIAERNLRNFERAQSAINNALDIAPNNRLYRELSALSLRDIGEFAASIEQLETLRSEFGDSESVLEYLKVCHYQDGHRGKSIAFGLLGLKLRLNAVDRNLDQLRLTKKFTGKKVVSFSLWGNHLCYLFGAIINAKRMPLVLPDWTPRFYVGDDVPDEIVECLAGCHAEIVRQRDIPDGISPYMWRFLVIDDPQVSLFACRDTDSRMSTREVAAVEEWLCSDLPFHIMRDHPFHNEPILAGLWGGVADPGIQIADRILRFFKQSRDSNQYGIDQYFLKQEFWPYVSRSCLIHDTFYRLEDSRPFPFDSPQLRESDIGHVGEGIIGTEAIKKECELFGLQELFNKYSHLPAAKRQPA